MHLPTLLILKRAIGRFLSRALNSILILSMLSAMISPAVASAAPVAQPTETTSQPAPAAAPRPAPEQSGRAARLESATESVGKNLLPSWMHGVKAETVTALELGTQFAPAWLSSARTTMQGLGKELLPGWYAAKDQSGLFSPGPGQCPASASLDIQLTPPAYTVSRGNTAGDVYTVTVTNNAALSVTEVSLLIDPNAGFYYLGGSAAVVSSISGTLSYADTGTGAPNANAVVTVTGDITATALNPGETLTFTFRLATDGDAVSGQGLVVTLRSGDSPVVSCKSALQNITTARGNLVVEKSPNIRSAKFGDTLAWTIRLRNTSALANVYGAQVGDLFGGGYIATDVSALPTTPITLTANQSASYVVTGTVNSCNQLTNTASAHWGIGNQDATATITTPWTSQTDVIFTLERPNVTLQVTPATINVPYCTTLSRRVTITATNSAGPAKTLELMADLGAFTPSNLSAGWNYAGGSFIYSGGMPPGTLYSGSPVTLTFDLSGPTACSSGSSASLSFRPHYHDACDLTFSGAAVSAPVVTYAADQPGLTLSKSGPATVVAGESFSYAVVLNATNIQNITDTISLTDVVPAPFQVTGVSATAGTPGFSGQQVTWSVPTPGSGNLAATLTISATARDDAACQAFDSVVNTVNATAPGCPNCAPLSASASWTTYIQDVEDPTATSKVVAGDTQVCGVPGFTITNTYGMSLPANPVALVFTETLGYGDLASPLLYETGSLSVTFNGIDRTAAVTINATSPRLVLDLYRLRDALADLQIVKSSTPLTATAGGTITYTLTVTNSGPGAAAAVVVTDVLPAGLTLVSATPSQGTCNTTVACALGALAVDDSATITVVATVNAGQVADLVNVAYVTSNSLDARQTDNQAAVRTAITTTSPLTATDLLVVKSGLPASLAAGENVTYTVVITNAGSYTATNAALFDALPYSFTLVSATPSQGTCSGSHPLTCALGTLGIAATATITIVATADAGQSADAANAAYVVADNPDPDWSNNSATAQTHVVKRLPLVIRYRATVPEAALGGLTNVTFFDWSQLQVGGGGQACRGDDTFYNGAGITISRGDLDAGITAPTPNSCEVTPVTVNVAGGDSTQLTDNLVVTLTLGTRDVYTITSYSGFFAANPPSSVISNANRITWTWPAGTAITSSGAINLDVLRPCGGAGALTNALSFQDRCDASFTKSGSNSFTPTAPQLSLFVTPDEYEVVENRAQWRIYVTNIGDGDAVNALITNTLAAGLTFSYSVVSGATGVITTTGVGDGNDVRWLIPRLPASGQVEINVYVDVTGCSGLTTQVVADASCGGASCTSQGPEEVRLLRSRAALLSANQQVAALPMCETGPVELVVQNASGSATEYFYHITDTLRYLHFMTNTARITVTTASGALITTTSAFQPLVITDGITETLIWSLDILPPDSPLRAILAERKAGEVIRITFDIQTRCDSTDQNSVASAVHVNEACMDLLTTEESARTLATTEPELVVSKQVRNVTLGNPFGGSSYAGVGDTLTWQVVVTNTGQQRVTNLFFEDQLPAEFNITAVSPSTTSQAGTPPLLKWDESGGKILNIGAAATYFITGTVGPNACNLSTLNVGQASYGCSESDICLTTPVTASVTYTTQPAFTISAVDATVDQCSGGPITLDFANTGARAQNVVVTYTLPSGLAYNGLAAGSNPTATLIYSPAVGATGVITWMYSSVDTLVTTNTLQFNVKNAAGVCASPGALGPNTADMRYEDTCGNPFDNVTAGSNTITVLASNISATQAPLTRTVVFDQVYTWTITITNSNSFPNNSPTNNLVVTETLGSGWGSIAAAQGRVGGVLTGSVPVVAGNVITWSVGSLTAGSTYTATFNARSLNAATDYRMTLTATTSCSDGGCHQARSYTDYASPINYFTKTVTPTLVTVGDLVTFTVVSDLFGNVPYTSTIVTDALPSGLGYVSATLLLVTDRDGSSGGPVTTTVVPSSAPGVGASGNVVWNLGSLSGQVSLTAVITAVVQNLIATTFQGAALNNTAALTYRDDGQSYSASSSATVTVTEPFLHIGKSYVTPSACSATLFERNFNSGVVTDWTVSGGTWSLVSNTYQAATGATRRSINGSTSWTDYSFSAMLRSTDTDGGDIGLIFRASNINQYYRFRWNRNAGGTAGSYVIERVNGGTITALGTSAGSYYETNRWYHVEIRVEGNRFRVYIDGVLALDRTDSSPVWTIGAIGFYTNNQTNAFLDDVLVTRLQNTGCTVAAGDLITYTLTISNQGQATGDELVITDVIPTGTSLYTYTFSKSDGGSAVTTAPSPLPGATGNLVWTVNQLAAISPFVTNNHSAITLTVVLSVTPDIPAASLLTNQVLLTYDSQVGTGRAGVQRTYSGGSHSATVQTVSPPGILKARSPLTATIGQYVFYTLTVPSTPITAALHTITVTDQLPANLALVGAPAITGGVGGTDLSAGDVMTVTFTRIEASAQATIAYTGVVRNIAANQDGVVVTNTGRLAWQDGVGAPQTPLTATATFTVVEPLLAISKVASPSSGLETGNEVTYTITISHAAASKVPAYDLVVQDVIPDVLTYKPGSLQAPGAAATFESSQQISATYTALPLGASLVLTYVVTVDQAAQASSLITNTAIVSHTSMPGDNPNERTGNGIAPNDYYTNTGAPIRTLDLSVGKALVEDRRYTIGEAITYTISVVVPALSVRRLTLTDTVPAGLRYDPTASFLSLSAPIALPSYTITQAPIGGGTGDTTSTFTLAFDDAVTNTASSAITIALTFRLIVADVAASNHGDAKVNTATLTYSNADGTAQTAIASAPAVTLTEPLLVIEKIATTTGRAGDTVFYDLRIYHAATSTVPAYNVAVTDIVPSGVSYVSGSWMQTAGPTAVTLNDLAAPQLTASWSVIPTSIVQTNPLRLRFNGVLSSTLPPGTQITNTITGTWTSLLDDPFGDRRDGSGGVDDYRTTGQAAVELSQVTIAKTGPLTVTAGSVISYQITALNYSASPAQNAIITDTMPFQVTSGITATFSVPGGASGVCSVTPAVSGAGVICYLGDIPGAATASVIVTGTVDADTPLAADLTNRATFEAVMEGGILTSGEAAFETEVYTVADVGLRKTGPSSVTAGQTVSYTIVLSNTGPSTARTVDMKELLPAGVTYSSGSTTQGACVSGICQLGDVAVGQTITMVVTGTVGSNVTGTITNTAQVFADTADTNATNNTSSASSTVNTSTQLQIVKNDLTDPVYAGDTYFYEIVITDALPSQVSYVGGSPDACIHSGAASGGVVTCTIGTLAAGASRDYLLNVRLDSGVLTGTIGTNTVRVTTTTSLAAGSVISHTELTTYWAKTGGLTDLVLAKTVSPATAVAGSGRVTYTVVVTNSGPSVATAVQVVDALPREFDFVSASVAGGTTGAACNSGVTCDLQSLNVGQRVTITIVADVPSNVAANTYTNTATVSSANLESNTANNTANAAVTVTQNAVLAVRKVANPTTATAGQSLGYTILVTNTGPSDAASVTVSETLPSGFSLGSVVPSQGGCTAFPCNLGTIVAGGNATINLYGTVSTSVTGALTNTVSVTSTTAGSSATFTLTTPISGTADLALVKAATATAQPGGTITYTLTVYNLGPSQAQSVRITDTLPVSVTFGSASADCTESNGVVVCTLTSLAAGASSSFVVTVTAASGMGASLKIWNGA